MSYLHVALLRRCAETFRTYEKHHRAKSTPESFAKADANAALAQMVEEALATTDAAPAPYAMSKAETDALNRALLRSIKFIDAPGVYALGDRVRKKSGSQWSGRVVGYYSTALTPQGVAVESEHHVGSVQIYPATALESC